MRPSDVFLWIVLVTASLASLVMRPIDAVRPAFAEPLARQEGVASFYSDSFAGQKTATGDTFSQNKLTAASRKLPLGARATVTNQENGKSVNVKINDRGPYVDGRVIDLSKKAARKIGITQKEGVAPVKVEARPSSQPTPELKQEVRKEAVTQHKEALAQER